MSPELQWLIEEAGEKEILQLLATATTPRACEPIMAKLYPHKRDMRRQRFRAAFRIVHRAQLHDVLSPKQIEIVGKLCDGLTQKEAAAELGMHYTTLCAHVSKICARLGVDNMLQAIVKLSGYHPALKTEVKP